jgi:hypothetical protein
MEEYLTLVSHNEPQESLGVALVKTAATAGVTEIAMEFAEVALDATLEDGVVKELPVVGLLAKGYNVYTSIRERLFLKKILKFLAGISEVSPEQRHKFAEQMVREPTVARQVGEALILHLERQEHFDKCFIIGRVFAGFIRSEIGHSTMMRLITAIDRSTIEDLSRLEEYYQVIDRGNFMFPFQDWSRSNSQKGDSSLGAALVRSGLVEERLVISDFELGFTRPSDGSSRETRGKINVVYIPNTLGNTLIALLKGGTPSTEGTY